MPRIVSYTWANPSGPDHDTTGLHPPLSATSTIGIREETSPSTVTYIRPVTPLPLYDATAADQITTWSGLTSHCPTGSYSFNYSPTTKRISILSTTLTMFQPVLPEATAIWLGFTQGIYGYDTNWTADDPPAGVVELYGVTVEPPIDAARVELTEYRGGRASATVWGNHSLHRCILYVRAADVRAFDPGYLMAGRVRITQANSNHTAYSATNLGGVVDGFVVASTDLTEDGDIGELWTVTLLIAVARG